MRKKRKNRTLEKTLYSLDTYLTCTDMHNLLILILCTVIMWRATCIDQNDILEMMHVVMCGTKVVFEIVIHL